MHDTEPLWYIYIYIGCILCQSLIANDLHLKYSFTEIINVNYKMVFIVTYTSRSSQYFYIKNQLFEKK